MRYFGLKKDQMSDAAYIDDAAEWSKTITRMRTRCPGDMENAMRQIEREYGIDYWFLWRLRYRRDQIKTISHSVYERLKAAYNAERERQYRMLKHDIAETEKVAGADAPALDAAKALVVKVEGAQ